MNILENNIYLKIFKVIKFKSFFFYSCEYLVIILGINEDYEQPEKSKI